MQPGLLLLLARLEVVDLRLLLHGEPDVVEAVQQAMLAERIDVEMHRAAVGSLDLLILEIDPFRKHLLLNGLDDIGLTMEKASDIDAFEKKQKESQPWMNSAA